jgi:ABC-type amino acid transport substrate-binding protein
MEKITEIEMRRRREDPLQKAEDKFQEKWRNVDTINNVLNEYEQSEAYKKLLNKRKKRAESDAAALENQKMYGMKNGGKVSSASARADGCAQRGKTKGKML